MNECACGAEHPTSNCLCGLENSMEIEKRPDWDMTYMSLCYVLAQRSPDLSTKVGSYLTTKDNVEIASGYNGLPRDMEHLSIYQERPGKYFYFEHAERNAIYNAGRTGARLGLAHTIYIPWLPCADCARAIIQSTNIQRIVVHKQGQAAYQHSRGNVQGWDDSHHAALHMFEKTKRHLEYYDGDILFNAVGQFTGKKYTFGPGYFKQIED